MTETSREYWRDPYKYATNDGEQLFGTPSYYLDPFNQTISENIERILSEYGIDRNWRILEIGCNCGRNLDYLSRKGYTRVAGVEINPAAVEHAWRVLPHVAKNMVVSDAQSFLAMSKPKTWDVIFTQSILMHVPPEDSYLFGQMARVADKMILTCEVEMGQRGDLMRHKFARNYGEVFTKLGWKQVHAEPERRRTVRLFTP
jgi:SAM-dependent methyltransferase